MFGGSCTCDRSRCCEDRCWNERDVLVYLLGNGGYHKLDVRFLSFSLHLHWQFGLVQRIWVVKTGIKSGHIWYGILKWMNVLDLGPAHRFSSSQSAAVFLAMSAERKPKHTTGMNFTGWTPLSAHLNVFVFSCKVNPKTLHWDWYVFHLTTSSVMSYLIQVNTWMS